MNAAELKATLRRTEVWFKLILLAFFGGLAWQANSYPDQSRQFPQLIALVSLALLVLALIRDFTSAAPARVPAEPGEDGEPGAGDPGRVVRAWGVILVATALGYLGGFLLSAFFFFMGFGFFFGDRQRLGRTTAIAIGITLVIYVVFETIMGVPLLAGVLW